MKVSWIVKTDDDTVNNLQKLDAVVNDMQQERG